MREYRHTARRPFMREIREILAHPVPVWIAALGWLWFAVTCCILITERRVWTP